MGMHSCCCSIWFAQQRDALQPSTALAFRSTYMVCWGGADYIIFIWAALQQPGAMRNQVHLDCFEKLLLHTAGIARQTWRTSTRWASSLTLPAAWAKQATRRLRVCLSTRRPRESVLSQLQEDSCVLTAEALLESKLAHT